jgi:hypothetical protein
MICCERTIWPERPGPGAGALFPNGLAINEMDQVTTQDGLALRHGSTVGLGENT